MPPRCCSWARQRFQSSPAPRRGCCLRFSGRKGQCSVVSILTRAEARVLPFVRKHRAPYPACFNPHPRRGAGAALPGLKQSVTCRSFNPHPRRGAGAARACLLLHPRIHGFNPHPRRGAGAASEPAAPVQARACFNPHPRRGAGAALRHFLIGCDGLVSILTRAEARVLLESVREDHEVLRFQSSPAPRRGCCRVSRPGRAPRPAFQSSPAPRRGCCAAYKFAPNAMVRFNPHPRRGAGAA